MSSLESTDSVFFEDGANTSSGVPSKMLLDVAAGGGTEGCFFDLTVGGEVENKSSLLVAVGLGFGSASAEKRSSERLPLALLSTLMEPNKSSSRLTLTTSVALFEENSPASLSISLSSLSMTLGPLVDEEEMEPLWAEPAEVRRDRLDGGLLLGLLARFYIGVCV